MSSLNQKIETPNPYAREDCPSLSRFSFGVLARQLLEEMKRQNLTKT